MSPPSPRHASSRSPVPWPLSCSGRRILGALLALLLLLGVVFTPRPALASEPQQAVLAGGCFWCLEHDLEGLNGVLEAVSGYSGGDLANPTYAQVSAGGTGHQEAVQVRFDPALISYPTLLRAYWRNVDPLDGAGQFCDRGDSYRPVIFTSGGDQQAQAEASQESAAQALTVEVSALQVAIRPLQRFWPAEAYHQNYADQNGTSYGYYRWACGRDRRLRAVWGDQARAADPW